MSEPAPTPLRAGSPIRSITVVVPTYREVESIPHLIDRIRSVRESTGLDLEVLFMDDDSKDGSEALVASLGLPWARIVVRKSDRGLSQAVLEGLRTATGDALVVMDADLSHPPEKIPEILAALEQGAEIVVGSRFTEGGSIADDWGLFRWLNSRVASLLAMPLTRLRDPMSGFFALSRSTFVAGRDFNPIGYKIMLECIIKCRCERVIEVPIHFEDRRFGESKLSLQEQLRFLQHLRRLYVYRYGNWSHLAQFLVVGFSGLVVNLALLTLLMAAGLTNKRAVSLAIAVSMIWNFTLNRRFSFSYARNESLAVQLVGFVAACSLGSAVNYLTTVALWEAFRFKQMAAIAGVLAGTGFNFLNIRYLVFGKRDVRAAAVAVRLPRPRTSA